jgi:hypothetical protein
MAGYIVRIFSHRVLMGKYSYYSLPLTTIVIWTPRHHIMAFHSISGLLLGARYPHQLSLPQWFCSPPISTFQKCKLTLQNSTCIHINICTNIHITDLATIHNHRKRARPRNLCLQNGGLQFDRQSVMSTFSNVLKYSYAMYKHHGWKKTKRKTTLHLWKLVKN